jgi:sterol desaturase/sphingolipid hydroxylase (fatty acid hydroxylase superfamily)
MDVVTTLRALLPLTLYWPDHWPLFIQLLLVGAIIDFGLWFMHWASHRNNFLWRLHALHHSSERLYWLNGERRHPVSAVLLALPGISAVVLLGAPAELIGCWLSMIAVHLSFQHSNLDYSVGVFRKLLGVAEVHRWHHKREYHDAQVNFGEFWMIWDHLFGTYRYQPKGLKAGEVGLLESMPSRYVAQIKWPFEKRSLRNK